MGFDRKKYMKAWRLAHCEQIKEYRHKHWKEYYLTHREQMKKNMKKYTLAHIKEERERKKKWRLAHLEHFNNVCKKYHQTPKGKETRRRENAVRRQFNFIPLNEFFEGSVGHHIDLQRVIYIPKEMHKETRHSVVKDINMSIINLLAFNWLEAERYC